MSPRGHLAVSDTFLVAKKGEELLTGILWVEARAAT